MAAIGDAYAANAYYEARNSGGVAVSDQTTLTQDLKAVSRALDAECGLAPGTLNDVSGLTLYFDGHGGDLLRLRDDRGLLWLVRTIDADGIGIDTEDDGTYDGYTLDLNDAWVVGAPANNAAVGKPYDALQLLPYLNTCNPSAWPTRKRAVRLNCTVGYATMPDQMKEIVCAAARELRDELGAGAAQQFQRFDDSMPLSSQTWRQIARLKAEFNRRVPAVA